MRPIERRGRNEPREAKKATASRRLRVLFLPNNYVLAHVGRCVEVAKVLRDMGHEPILAGYEIDHPRSRLDHAVAEGFPVVEVIQPRFHWAFDRFQKYGFPISIYDAVFHKNWAPLDKILEDVVRVVKEYRIDLIVGDAGLGISAAGYITGVHAAGLANSYNARFMRKDLRIIYWLWDHLLLQRERNRVYRKHGVKPKDSLRLFAEMPLLSPDLPEFHFSHPFFPHWFSVGPIYSEPPCELPPWYDELQDGTTNIYVTFGSTGILEPFLKRVYKDFGEAPFRFIVTTSRLVSPEVIAAAPKNFRFAEYVPGSKILPHCRAMIYHGGNGTMYQSLAAGVPMLGLPSQLEQVLSVDLQVEHGFALRGSARWITGKQALRKVEELLSDNRYRKAAQRFQYVVQNTCGATNAARYLVAYAQHGIHEHALLSETVFFPEYAVSPRALVDEPAA
jgi:UDP:flavonoid glycosyltransferase YjiC (YdhE family)